MKPTYTMSCGCCSGKGRLEVPKLYHYILDYVKANPGCKMVAMPHEPGLCKATACMRVKSLILAGFIRKENARYYFVSSKANHINTNIGRKTTIA